MQRLRSNYLSTVAMRKFSKAKKMTMMWRPSKIAREKKKGGSSVWSSRRRTKIKCEKNMQNFTHPRPPPRVWPVRRGEMNKNRKFMTSHADMQGCVWRGFARLIVKIREMDGSKRRRREEEENVDTTQWRMEGLLARSRRQTHPQPTTSSELLTLM